MMMGEGQHGVTVKKEELLKELRANRSKHREGFLAAQKGYREAVIKELDSMLEDARTGKAIRRGISFVEPSDHSSDYDRVIKQLEMCTKDEILIDDQEFAQYVMDDWGWKKAWSTTNATYGVR